MKVMSVTLRHELSRAAGFLKHYVILSRSRDDTSNASLVEDLYAALPASARQGSEHATGAVVVVEYCMDILENIDLQQSSETAGQELQLGLTDIRSIDVMVELVTDITLRPLLYPGLGTNIPGSTTASGSREGFLYTIQNADDLWHRLMEIVTHHGAVSRSLKRLHQVGLLVAFILARCYGPTTSVCSPALYRRLISSLDPPKLLQVMQLLLAPGCPAWAVKQITTELTNLLLRKDGLRWVSAFVLQPDPQGNIPLQRFDHLASLVAAKPSTLTEERYLEILTPQLIAAFDDDSAKADISRKSTSMILDKLSMRYSTFDVVTIAFWDMLPPESLAQSEVSDRCLRRLELASSFVSLRKCLFHSYMPFMLRKAYQAHQMQAFAIRDILERLIYRYVQTDPVEMLIRGFDSVVDSMATETNDQDANTVDSTHSYFMRILDQIRDVEGKLSDVLSSVTNSYTIMTSPLIKNAHLRLTMELSTKYASLIFNPTRASYWIRNCCETLQKLSSREIAMMPDVLIIQLHIIKTMLDLKLDYTKDQAGQLDQLNSALKSLTHQVNRPELLSTMHALYGKLDLLCLQLSVKRVSLDTATQPQLDVQEARKRYEAALADMGDDMVPTRAHGLYLIGDMAGSTEGRQVLDLIQLTPVILGLLSEEEPFVFHNAIKAMKKMLTAYGDEFEILLKAALMSDRYPEATKDRMSSILSSST